ncbi:MAG: SDR family oxidoreductase [Proteobacteria bacterium]|nr:SDR family oxidoreductase [Pseudomonadota bacterium]
MTDINQRVLVTAGGSGIGRAIAEAFLASGARVHIADIDASAIAAMCADNPGATSSVTDVANEQEVTRTVDEAVQSMGGDINVMINCAGIAGPTAFVEDLSFADWHRCIAVNLDSTFLFTRAVAVSMKAAGSGSIINISSTAGWHGYPLRAAYASAKWAVIGFTKSMAMEMGPSGVRVNTICPGSINGARIDSVIANESKAKGIPEEAIRKRYTKSCSLRTFIDAEDIADMALFLASPAAKRVSGQIMNVDGHIENPGGLDN